MDLDKKFVGLHQSLMALSHDEGFVDQDRDIKLRDILKLCVQELQVSRASIWVFDAHKETLVCELLYVSEQDEFSAGIELFRAQYPNYFQAAAESRIINADDARLDPRTSEFTDSYLSPLNIYSMLDAPIYSGAKLSGVICIEHTKNKRTWDIAEMSYAASIADTISLMNSREVWLSTKQKMELIDRTDSLTGLENRRYFHLRLDSDLRQAKLKSNHRSLILVGLDHFTELNDTLGVEVADDALFAVSERLEQVADTFNCKVARVNGDIFGIWVADVKDELTLTHLIEYIQTQIRQPTTVKNGEAIEISASVGVYTYNGGKDYVKNNPIRCAEVALARAKSVSRGEVIYYSVDWAKQLEARQIMEAEILDAFESHQFVSYYQPIVCTDSKKVKGVEALVRWAHPTKGIVSPFMFLPLIRDLGLVSKLGKVMLKQACKDLKELRSLGHQIDWVSVNVAAEQLYDSHLVADIHATLKQNNLPASSLELEIVEELISQDSELVRSQLLAVAELGVGISIDDFGTGFSSLSRLKHLPVSKLKIDKSFVDGLPASEDDQCIAQSIIGLAKGLGLSIVAEGVEKIEQAEWLAAKECDLLQGYLYSKPLNTQDLISQFFS